MEALFKAAPVSRKWPLLIRYGLATLLAALAVFLTVVLYPNYIDDAENLCIFAVVISSAFLGHGTSIYITLLSATAIAHYGFEDSALSIALFVALGLGIGALIEALYRAFTGLIKARDELSAAASQRQMLLDELSHRTRNDLTAIGGLLTLQAKAVEDTAAQSALQAAVGRINALARVHRRLSVQNSHAVVDSAEFMTKLCDDLKVTLAGLRPIIVRLSVESHPIALQRAVALGLIVNELLTNALKHAFPNGREGEIVVEFHNLGEDYYLCVRDNGVGLGTREASHGIGRQLVAMLVTQLDGRIEEKDAKPGALFAIVFPK